MTDNVFAPPQAELETRVGPEELWDMEYKQVRKLAMASLNIRALGALWGLGALAILAGVAVLVSAGNPDAREGAVGLAALFFVSGGLSAAASYTAYARPRWGRGLGIVLCILGLLNFPIGTAIGAVGIFAYVQGARLFGPDKLLHKDVMAVYKQRKKDKK